MIHYKKRNWSTHLFDLRGTMTHEIFGRVSACVVWGMAVVVFHHLVRPVGFAPVAHTLVSVALGLLLVFRTNASYDRFWEGRRLWGCLINETRNLARAARAFVGRDRATFERIVYWTATYPYATMNSLRGKAGLGPVAERLPQAEVEAVLAAGHIPLAVSVRISSLLADARDRGVISDYVAMTLDGSVLRLIDYLGGCERIMKTPLPFVYVIHLRRALILYCATLPFALLDTFGWWSILPILFIAYTVLGIEEIGVEIENPFGYDDNDLPLEQFCETIAANLLELVGERTTPSDVEIEAPPDLAGGVPSPDPYVVN